jgi:hypothetical protein
MKNFAAFLPGAQVILHVSAQARFTPAQLEAALGQSGCTNARINPQRLATGWGNILLAHLANIAWIRSQVPQCARICLHSSNDMLVRPGLARHLERGASFLHHRPILGHSRWRFATPALADPALAAVCRRLGSVPLIGSQVEGSSYEPEVLYEVADIIKHAARQAARVPYPREEVWLSTVAHARGARVSGTPYVFSEVHRFDRVFWKVLRVVDPIIGHRGNPRWLPRRALEFVMIRSGFHRIGRRMVDAIATDQADELSPYEWLSDGDTSWRVFDRHGLYGVKRVPRRPDSPLRKYIDELSAQPNAQAAEQPQEQLSNEQGPSLP